MKVSDYIVKFLIEKNITDVFGYPGGMVTHLMDSLDKYKIQINAHVNYNEQAAAFSACGYAQIALKSGVAYATSGPGATNLITGICNAYFDSIPTIFITGQVNTYEMKNELGVRQRGFQETDIISIIKSVTKYAVCVKNEKDIKYELGKAYYIANQGRKGPVLLDIPMNIQRAEVSVEELSQFIPNIDMKNSKKRNYEILMNQINKSKRPCILVGSGVRNSGMTEEFRKLCNVLGIPTICSMISIDTLPTECIYNFGFVGSYGNRCSNFILAKSDLIIALGTRMDIRQVGSKVENFAQNATLVRIDIDENELKNKIKNDEIQINMDLSRFIPYLNKNIEANIKDRFIIWNSTCNKIKEILDEVDIQNANRIIKKISENVLEDSIITTDVGQNQVWAAQSFIIKDKQRMLFSGGHGAMGYSLPAAIGAYYASKKQVICFNGDGGIQMNIQEIQFIVRENIPIKIVVLNNSSLGMIRQFQEMYFNSNYVQTQSEKGYTVPNFQKLAYAYGLGYEKIIDIEDVSSIKFNDGIPAIIEVVLETETYLYPKLAMNKLNQDQEPSLERELYNYIMKL